MSVSFSTAPSTGGGEQWYALSAPVKDSCPNNSAVALHAAGFYVSTSLSLVSLLCSVNYWSVLYNY